MTFAIALLLAIWTSAVAYSGDSANDTVQAAELQIRNGWLTEARETLEHIVNTKDGRFNAEAWKLLATINADLGDIDRAIVASDRAAAFTQSNVDRVKLLSLSSLLRGSFGEVNVRGSRPGFMATLQLKVLSSKAGSTGKHYLSNITPQLAEKEPLPRALWLPVGEYEINGIPFSITNHTLSEITLPPSKINSPVGSIGNNIFIESSFGFNGWFGEQAPDVLGTTSEDFGLGYHIYHLVLTAGVQRTGWSYRAGQGDLFTQRSWSPKISLGYNFSVDDVSSVRLGAIYSRPAAPTTTLEQNGVSAPLTHSVGGYGTGLIHARAGAIGIGYGLKGEMSQQRSDNAAINSYRICAVANFSL